MSIHPAFENDKPLFTCKVDELFSHREEIQGGGIYQIKNLLNNKVYIGSTTNFYERFKNHYYSLIHNDNVSKIQSDWNMHSGKHPFVFDILKIVDDNTNREMLYNLEQIYLNEHNSCVVGYNSIRETESSLKYKDKNKRSNNIEMTKNLEVVKHECLKYINDNFNEHIDIEFQYKQNKMTTHVYDKLHKLYTIFPYFYQAVIDCVVPNFPNMGHKLKIIAWTTYIKGDSFPEFRLKGMDHYQDFIRFDAPFYLIVECFNKYNLTNYYDVFKEMFNNKDEYPRINIVENNQKRKGEKRPARKRKMGKI